MRLFILALSALATLGTAGTAQAQSSTRQLEKRIQILEMKTAEQDRTIDELFDRVDRMDRRGPRQGPRPGPRPDRPDRPGRITYDCSVTDSGYSKTFLGSGSTQLDAEFAAKESCQKSVNASYCQSTPKCASTADMKGAVGAVCVVTDSGYSKTFRGEAATTVGAEAAAKMTCQASVNASYCGNAPARCELKY